MTHSFTALAIAFMLSILSSFVYASALMMAGRPPISAQTRYVPVEYCELITTSSQVYGVPSSLILAVIKQESNFNADVISHKGAKG